MSIRLCVWVLKAVCVQNTEKSPRESGSTVAPALVQVMESEKGTFSCLSGAVDLI